MNDRINRWGTTWRDSTSTNAAVSLGINGDLGLAIMMSHGMTLLALTPVKDKMWPDALVALVVVHSIWAKDGEVDYIAVILDATLCHIELCPGAQESGLQFLEGFADDYDNVIVTFTTVEAAIEQVNKERADAAAKSSKRPCIKKSDTAAKAHEIGNERAVTGESSRPKQKSTSANGEKEASKAKKLEGKLTLAAATVQANNLTSKRKPSNVEVMYSTLQ